MKRVAALLVLMTACKTVVVNDSAMTGAASPKAAVERILLAAQAQDIQAIGAVFGNDKGPLRDQEKDRTVMERKLLIQLQCLKHESHVISDPARGEGGTQVFMVAMKQGTSSANVKFTTMRGPSDRWYVAIFDIVALQNAGFCSKAGG